ncbi:MAG: efflux RND transporter periplasmic adaptor subunit [Vicinamibacterales bacterium]|nr:efflux RND transporter periplasmic adaptor subunit [Vicinamibacterales bacterium]
MTLSRSKVLIGLAVVAVGAAVVYANFYFARDKGPEVAVEAVKKRDLEAVVSASGKIQPKRSVNISADTMGRVTELAINEGDTVKRGQFLLQIDPRNLESNFQRGQAGLAASQAQLEQFRTAIETARANLALSQDNLKRQRDLWAEQLTTKEALDRAETEARLREKELVNAQQQVTTQQARIREQQAVLSSARYDLSKVRIESPIDGIVTRRNIEQGEMVVIGTMNNAGTVLMTLADMSVIEAEVEVDETDIPFVRIGQVAKITIDALPDQEFTGKVTEIGNSPIQATAQTGTQATNFKVVVTLDTEIPGVRPGFTCTADITTATRQQAVAVPIQAMVVREMILDEKEQIVRKPRTEGRRRGVETPVSAEELPAGQKRKELEGVFVMKDGAAVFTPVKTGIAGDKYFELVSGLDEGAEVITGPFNSVRDLQDGDTVRLQEPAGKK